jgi:hypothetical protein
MSKSIRWHRGYLDGWHRWWLVEEAGRRGEAFVFGYPCRHGTDEFDGYREGVHDAMWFGPSDGQDDEGTPDEVIAFNSFDSLARVFRAAASIAPGPRPACAAWAPGWANREWDRLVQHLPLHVVRVLELLRQGFTPAEVAGELGLNERAIRRLIHKIDSRFRRRRAGRAEGVTVPMSPEGWGRCDDPQRMLAFLGDSPGISRRLRLFACACCWRLRPILDEERRRRPVEAAERFADGLASEGEMEAAAFPAPAAVGWVTDRDAARAATKAAACAAGTVVPRPGGSPGRVNSREERAVQATLLRCIFGPWPLRPVTVPADVLAWAGGAAGQVAAAIDTDRRFEDLPILADLLEEAGYTDEAVLAHLRGPGQHAKGCHALDAVLGKT